jgi:hypothetical protein
MQRIPHGMMRSRSHFELPFQLLMGVFFFTVGLLLLLKMIGRDYAPFIPQEVLIPLTAVGCLIGGFYLIIIKFWRPRIYL